MKIKLVKSTFYKEEETKKKLADFILGAQFLSMGAETRKFEENFAKKQERKFAVMTTSGSAANLLLLQALKNIGKLKDSSRVGFSALTWSTNVMPIIQLGMKPVALDCELATLNVSPRILNGKMEGLDALFLTNVLGFADDIAGIKELCRKHDILFIEDNCESLGSKVGDRLLGNFGLAATFSFFVGHHFSTVEGGMVVTDDEELYHELLMARAHGWDRNLPEKRQKEIRVAHKIDDFFAKYAFYSLAYNMRPTEIQGFLGHDQLSYWDEIVSKRASNFEAFAKAIAANQDLISLRLGHMELVSNFAMPMIAKDKKNSEHYRKIFEDNEVEIRPVIAGNITRHPFYGKYVAEAENLKNADFIHENGFYFPNNAELTEEEISYLLDLLQNR